MLDKILSLFSHDLAVDFGTSSLRILVKNKGVMVNEPNVILRNKKTKSVFCVGKEAKQMIGRVPPQAESVRPITRGAISDFDAAAYILRHYIEQVHRSYGLIPKIPKPKTIIAVTNSATDVENKAYIDVSQAAGSRKTILVSKPLSAILGMNLSLSSVRSVFMVDIGGGTTEIVLVAKGSVVLSKLLKIGSYSFDEAIANFIRLKYGILIGDQTAEKMKKSIGLLPGAKLNISEKFTVARGRDLESSLPRSVRVSSSEIGETLTPIMNIIIENIKELMEKAPPDFFDEAGDLGIMLIGGGCQISGIPEMITGATRMSAYIAPDPGLTIVRGMQKALQQPGILKKISL